MPPELGPKISDETLNHFLKMEIMSKLELDKNRYRLFCFPNNLEPDPSKVGLILVEFFPGPNQPGNLNGNVFNLEMGNGGALILRATASQSFNLEMSNDIRIRFDYGDDGGLNADVLAGGPGGDKYGFGKVFLPTKDGFKEAGKDARWRKFQSGVIIVPDHIGEAVWIVPVAAVIKPGKTVENFKRAYSSNLGETNTLEVK